MWSESKKRTSGPYRNPIAAQKPGNGHHRSDDLSTTKNKSAYQIASVLKSSIHDFQNKNSAKDPRNEFDTNLSRSVRKEIESTSTVDRSSAMKGSITSSTIFSPDSNVSKSKAVKRKTPINDSDSEEEILTQKQVSSTSRSKGSAIKK